MSSAKSKSAILKNVLVIVESPAKCDKIANYLGSGYSCMATYGHLQQLPDLKHIDSNNNYHPTFVQLDSKKQQIGKLL